MPEQLLYNRYKTLSHIIFWLFSIALLTLVFYAYDNQLTIRLIEKSVFTNMGFAIAVYVNLLILIPRFLKQKNYIFYIFWLVVLLSASSLFIQFLFLFPLNKLLGAETELQKFSNNLHSAYFFATFIYVSFTSFLKFIKDWLEMQDLNLKLAKIEQQKLEAELNTLKSQLNPHFLFNSLNNIYSLSLINSDKVPDLILRLSDLMRHIIYESREKYIDLDKELDFVNNFVALQKIRTSEKNNIDYQIFGEIPVAKIAPLLFEPFIDNAFKHGLPGNQKADFIQIHFDFSKPGELEFKIENNFEETGQWSKKNSGIGIDNVKQRLKLLYSRNEYVLEITKKEQIHAVRLKLKLK